MTSPEAKLKALVESGAIALEGRPHGGAGRGMASLGGQKYAYPGGDKVSKTLAEAVSAAYAARTRGASAIQRAVRRRVLRPGAPQESAAQAEREVRRRRDRTVKSKNEHAHEVVQGLRSINRGEIDSLRVDLRKVKARALKTLILANVVSEKRLALKLPNGRYYFLNDRSLSRLADGLVDAREVYGTQTQGSDEELLQLVDVADSLEIVTIAEGRKRAAGAFFKYTHRTKFDWSRYGIFPTVDPCDYLHNCLYLALEAGGLESQKLQRLKHFVINRHVAKCRLGDVAASLDIYIRLKTIRPDASASRQETFGDKAAPTFDLGLVDDHYFINEKVPVTRYCLEHYEAVKDLEDCHSIFAHEGKRYRRDTGRYIDSFRLFQTLLEQKEHLLESIVYGDAIASSQFYNKIHHFGNLEYGEKNLRYQTYEPKGKGEPARKVFFDFETCHEPGQEHKPYLCCYETEDGIQREFLGPGCALDMLRALTELGSEELLLIAHNANYDARFILHFLDHQKVIDKGNRFLAIRGTFVNRVTGRKVRLVVRDSIRMVDMPLKKFGEAFNLDVAKEVMPYSLYTPANVAQGSVPMEEALRHVADGDREQFLANVERWGARLEGDRLDLLRYSAEYCKIDCRVLKEGYERFREMMHEHVGLDPASYLTVQSLGADYCLKEGIYEDVPQVSGIPQAFLSEFIVGGRCMTNSNRSWHVKGPIEDLDATSLYPSAMKRLGGFLKGAPKPLAPDQLNLEHLGRCDGYFVKVRVLSVGKCREFPLASVVDPDKGTREWTNNLVGQVLHLDRFGLEDLIRWQNVTVEILQGYYFDEGRNPQLADSVQHLFELRARLKREKNPAEKCIKLLLNSLYGRSILRPIETDTVVVPADRYVKFVSMNYAFIHSAIQVGPRWYVKKIRPINDHMNHVQCGIEVLSMSKRVMGELMTLAEDEGHKILYQDTDSTFLSSEAVPKLAEAFRREYGRELIGDGLGQFTSDFKLRGAKSVYAAESVFVGKKVYCCHLVGDSLKEPGKLVEGMHVRCKGVPTGAVVLAASLELFQQYLNTGAVPWDQRILGIYEDLLGGKPVTFDLTCGGDRPGFVYGKDLACRSYIPEGVTRTLRFGGG